MIEPLWKLVWRVLKNLKLNLTQDSGKPLLDTHQTDSVSYFRDTDLSMFIAVLFIIARNWK